MRFLVYGAGTIGTVYGWLLSKANDVDFFIKESRLSGWKNGVALHIKDLRQHDKQYRLFSFAPNLVTDLSKHYDFVLVAVNRTQLKDSLNFLQKRQSFVGQFVFMQNHWDLQAEIDGFLQNENWIAAFPSSVGGGRDEGHIDAIIYPEATLLGGKSPEMVQGFKKILKTAGIESKWEAKFFDWQKTHYLQQAVTAGALLETGSYMALVNDFSAMKKMVRAFREGLNVCRSYGINTDRIFPFRYFKLPLPIVALLLQKMLQDENTAEMVTNHMKKGLEEWVYGFREVLGHGCKRGIRMPYWKSYLPAVMQWETDHLHK